MRSGFDNPTFHAPIEHPHPVWGAFSSGRLYRPNSEIASARFKTFNLAQARGGPKVYPQEYLEHFENSNLSLAQRLCKRGRFEIGSPIKNYRNSLKDGQRKRQKYRKIKIYKSSRLSTNGSWGMSLRETSSSKVTSKSSGT
jgi:hypothetical protein